VFHSAAVVTPDHEAPIDEPCLARMHLYERAQRRDPNNHFLLLDLAREYGLHRRLIQAHQTLRQILRLYPQSARVRSMVADAYLQIGLPQQAREQYQQALRLDPDHPEAARIRAELECAARSAN